jgi:hypothetical protein
MLFRWSKGKERERERERDFFLISSIMSDETLKKRQRLLDNDRLKYQQAAQAQLTKQQESIANMRKENERMKQELAASTGGSYDFVEQDKLAALQAEVDQLERKVQYEKLRKNDLAKKYSLSRMDMMKSRKNMGGVNVTKENTQLIEKQVTVLENRLDQALVKFNEALAYNKNLREQIDNLREERKVFQSIYKKLESDLHEKKKAMADMIERANQDYEERDSLQQQLEALKQAAKEDQKKYEENFASIEAAMQQFKNARELQLQQQQNQQQMASTKQTTGGSKSDNAGGTQNQGTPEKHSKKNFNQTQQDLRQDGADANSAEQEADLQEVVDQLKEATGIQDLDVLYHKFVKAEEHNFSMYNFVNELSTEQEHIETEIAQLKEQLHGEKGDVQRRKLLKELENELAQTEQQYERLQSETGTHKETLATIRNVTQEIFGRLGCNADQARELVGSTEVTELNLLSFLGLIEQRTNEVLFAFNSAAQNEQRRRTQSKDEESRKRRERKAAERQARIEAGEHVPDDDDADEHAEEEGSYVEGDVVRSRFIGVGPSVGHNQVNATQLVKQHGLPNTNAGDAQTDNTDDVEEDNILSHEQLRQQMELRLQQKREKEERGGKGKKKERERKAGAKP